MAKTTFVDKSTVISTEWLNEVNSSNFDAIGDGLNSPTTPAQVRTNIDVNSATDIASTATGKGASLVGIEDAGGIVTATTVEGAIQEDVANLNTHMADTTTHGTTGDIVGTSDTQTLTNKTITSPDINGGTADSLTSLSVAANSSGNVSSYAMSTGTATAAYYALLETFTLPATSNVAANQVLLLTPKSTSGGYSPTLLSITMLQGASGLSTSSKIEVISSDTYSTAYNDFFLTTATATNGTNITLYMQSIIAAAYDVQLLSESLDTGISTSWNDGATWSATDPTSGAATSVTSDWAGTYAPVPTVEGGTTAGTATYSSQYGRVRYSGGIAEFDYVITFTGHTGTGTMNVIPNFPIAPIDSFVCNVEGTGHATYNIYEIYGSGAVSNVIYMRRGTTTVLQALPMDADMTLRISGTFRY